MLALVLRGFVQRKLRVLLTGIAVALGVALMAGTYVLTDTINHSFAGIFQTANRGHDVVITPTQVLGRNSGSETTPITDAMLAQVRATAGREPGRRLDLHAGHVPRREPQTAHHGRRARVRGLRGARALQLLPAGPRPLPLGPRRTRDRRSHRRTRETEGRPADARRGRLRARQALHDRRHRQVRRRRILRRCGHRGPHAPRGPARGRRAGRLRPDRRRAESSPPGVTPGELRDRLRAALPRTVDVRTGTEQASHDTSELESNLSFLRTFLLVFAYVSLVVGAFIIFNTFSITVAQRTREFGLLRTLGASRAQIMRSVVYEGLLLGIVGAVLGLLGGLLLAPALDQLFKAFGADLPDSGTVLETRTIVVSLRSGIGVTVLAGLAPAIRATRVPPLAAMREGIGIPPRPLPTKRQLIARFLLGLVVVFAIAAVTGGRALGFVLLVVVVPARAQAVGAAAARGRAPGTPLPHSPGLGESDRLADRLAWHHRPPGPGELDPPARPHADHGRRAHRGAGAGHAWWRCSPTAPRPRSTRRSAARSRAT